MDSKQVPSCHKPSSQFNDDGISKIRIPVPGNKNYVVEAGGQVLFKATFTLKLIIGIFIIFVLTSLILHCKIRKLEDANKGLEVRLQVIEMRLFNLGHDDDQRNKIPVEKIQVDEEKDANNDRNNEDYIIIHSSDNLSTGRAKRDLDNKNENKSKDKSPTTMPSWTTQSSPVKVTEMTSTSGSSNINQSQTTPDNLMLNFNFRRKARGERNERNEKKPRANYFIIHGPSVNIETDDLEKIGPWYMAQNGSEFGFKDNWLSQVQLDIDRNAIIFEEAGLYLIYSQVYYHITYGLNEKPKAMGYRIYLKKNQASKFVRPLALAECVPSFPTTAYATCFTQIVWYIEPGDRIYLGHFQDSAPMIQAEDLGQTFLGVVRF